MHNLYTPFHDPLGSLSFANPTTLCLVINNAPLEGRWSNEWEEGRGGGENKKRRACFSVARRATRRLITISKNSGNQIWHARSTPPSSCNFYPPCLAIILPTLLPPPPLFILILWYFERVVDRIPKFYFSSFSFPPHF